MTVKVSVNTALIRQIPFAVSLGLNGLAQRAKGDTEKQIARVFDRPTPFTRRAVTTKRATKAKPVAAVVIKDIQARYLGLQEFGGTRRPERKALLIPVGARLNQYGNMSRNQIARLLARPDVFSGEIKGVGGIWQRQANGRVKLLVAYEPEADYEPRFEFEETVRDAVRENVVREMQEAFAKAMASARL